MLTVLFFAQTKEVLKTDRLSIDKAYQSVGELRTDLRLRGDIWNEFLNKDKALVAVNHVLCDDDKALNTNDEVAFFPPVTGG